MNATHRLGMLLSLWLAGTSVGFAASAGGTNASGTSSETPPAFLVIYRAGPAWPEGKTLAELPLREHGRYMLDLHRRGVLRMAGGFTDDSGGAAVLEVATLDAARAIADADPAVTSGLFVYDLRPWRLVPWNEIAAKQADPAAR